MSDSRLEKFIYAICSMDVSDLPVPLSRIEKLWNCLITGETPDFEPLSRNEKYLMAMLDRYDISNLPAPMSRGEKLLYKIAVGETDLSDIPEYLSRYEELLKYLIENGGISGGDFEYILYTLNQSLYTLYTTAEKPVKSAILKGNTLVNIHYEMHTDILNQYWTVSLINLSLLKPSTRYLIKIKNLTSEEKSYYSDTICEFTGFRIQPNSSLTKIITTKNEIPTTEEFLKNNITHELPNDLKVLFIEYQDGMENWDIPYFEGMQSVKMPVLTTTGKNLFDINNNSRNLSGSVDNFQPLTFEGNQVSVTSKFTCSLQYLVKLKPNTKYTVTVSERNEHNKGSQFRIARYSPKESSFTADWNNLFTDIHLNNKKSQSSFVTDATGYIVAALNPKSGNEFLTSTFYNIQLEEGSSATTYEPYKSNILTVNDDVELRGIGDVRDELNLVTSELTERVGDITLDGSADEGWSLLRKDTMTNVFQIAVSLNIKPRSDLLSNLFDGKYVETIKDGVEVIKFNNSKIYVNISNTKATTVEDFKNYIAQQPLTIQYQLETESVKTVDLTVVDQDNQPTELGTFENVTHVSLEAENLIPEVEMEVATRISEELASASPLMDDISTKQEQLNTTVDEQSENVDATMIATTEIFEETL